MNSSFYITGGTLPQDALSYVTRQADTDLLNGLRRGEFCYVLTTRQMGKSSLMIRAANRLKAEGCRVAIVDLTAVGKNLTVEQWYFGLLNRVGTQIGHRRDLLAFWKENSSLGPMQRFVEGLRLLLMESDHEEGTEDGQVSISNQQSSIPIPSPLVLFVDEIDAVRSLPFYADEFFAGIRECYNRRAQEPVFARMTFCLLGVATPADLIRDTRTTPFNIGTRIELRDFTPEEAEPLALGLLPWESSRGGRETGRQGETADSSLSTRASTRSEGHNSQLSTLNYACLAPRALKLLRRILYWTNGHPYMTQRLCQKVAERLAEQHGNNIGPKAGGKSDELDDEAIVDGACEQLLLSKSAQETDDNLAFVRNRLLKSEADLPTLLDLYAQVRAGRRVRDDETNPLCDILRLSGVVAVERGQLRLRNRVYDRVFDREWIRAHMPGAELERQQRAYHLGMLRAALVGGVGVLLVASLAGIAFNRAVTARRAEQKAAEQEKLATLRLSRSYVEAGMRLMEAGDTTGALAPLAEAMILDKNDPVRMTKHRIRFASALARSPRLEKMWFTDKPLRCATFSPDKKRLAAADESGIVHLWEVDTGHEERLSTQDGAVITYLAFRPDGMRLATCAEDARARIWDLSTGRLLCALTHPKIYGPTGGVTHAAWNADGSKLVTCSADIIRVWDLRSVGTNSTEIRADRAKAFEETSAAMGNGATMVVDDRSPRANFTQVAFAPDSMHIAGVAKSYLGFYASLVNANPGFDQKSVYAIGSGDTKLPISCYHGSHIAFSADGRHLLVAGGFGAVNQYTGAGLFDLPMQAENRPVPTRGYPTLQKTRPFLLHEGFGLDAEFSPDEKRIVTAGEDHIARIWDVRTGKPTSPPLRHEGGVTLAQFSSDGKRILTASVDGTARIWNVADGASLCPPLRHASAVIAAEFREDNDHILTVSQNGTVRFWQLPPAMPDSVLFANHRSSFIQIPGDSALAAQSNADWYAPQAYVCEVVGGKRRFPPAEARPGWAAHFLSDDGRRDLLANLSYNRWQVWDVKRGQPLSPVVQADFARLNHQGDLLLLHDRKAATTRIVNAVSGKLQGKPFDNVLQEMDPRESNCSPDDRSVVVCDRANNVLLREQRTGKLMTPPMPHRQPIVHATFSPDGCYLFTWTKDNFVQAWMAATGVPASLSKKQGSPETVTRSEIVFSPDHHWGISLTSQANAPVLLWKLDGSNSLNPLPITTDKTLIPGSNIGFRRVGFSPDSTLFYALEQGSQLWSTQENKPITPSLNHSARVTCLAFSPDGQRLLSGSEDGTARIWQTRASAALTPPMLQNTTPNIALFNPNGSLAATASRGSIRIWDPMTGEAITPVLPIRGEVLKLEFTPDGGHLIGAATEEGRIWTLPMETGSLVHIQSLAQLLSGQRIDVSVGSMPIDILSLRNAWKQVQNPKKR